MDTTDVNNVLIVGAGPAGLCLAKALSGLGVTVDVVERQSEAMLAAPAFDGREIALNHRSIRILEELDIWAQIPEMEIHPLRRAHVGDGGDRGFDIDADRFGKDRLGNLVSNHIIRTAAWQVVRDAGGVNVHTDAEVKTLGRDDGAFTAHLADGRIFSAPLLVAADSRFSHIRRLLGVQAAMHDFGKAMLVCRMHHDIPHDNVAHEWFGYGQTRALLPLNDYTSSLVLTVTEREAMVLHHMDEAAFVRNVEARLDYRMGAMQLVSTRHVYPLVGTWSKKFSGPGFALAGDAAVGMHPVTAHGFNLGLDSIDRLTRAIEGSLARGGGVADSRGLAQYQRQHRAGALPLFLGTGAIVGLYTNDRMIMRPIRHTIIGHMRRLRPLRRALAATVMDSRYRARLDS